MLLNGFAIIEKDAKTDVLINAGSKNPFQGQVRIYVSGDDLPAGDRIITYVMKLDYITPDDALRVFQTVARPNTFTTIAPVENVNAVVITDNVPVVQALLQIKAQIDVPGTGVTPESIPLIRADAQEVAASLNEILQAQSSGRSGTANNRSNVVINRTAAASAVGTALSGGVNTAPDGNTIQIQAITRTNSILVIARIVDIAYIKSLVEIYDAPSQINNFLKRELKYIPVTDFMPVASDALSRYMDGAVGGSSVGSNRSTSSPRTTGLNGNNNNNRNGSNNRNGRTTGGFSGGGSSLSSSEALSGPESMLVGNTLIIGDSQLNNIVVSGPPEHLRIIDQLLDEIDIRPRQVYINAVIAQVELGDDIRFGMDLVRTVEEITVGNTPVDIAGAYTNTIGGTGVVNINDLIDVTDAFPRPDGLGVWAQVGDYFNAYIQALEQTNRFEVISRPFVFTANNQTASIASGERVAVPTGTITDSTSGNLNSSIGFEEVLLQLDVLPLINSKDEVTLTIVQQNENITGTTIISGNEVPNISTQTFETTVRLPNKAIVVLGGIIQEGENENVNGLPFLARIPGLRHLFGGTLKQKSRRELLILLQPHIIETTDDLVEKNIQEIRETIVGDNAINAARSRPAPDPALFPLGHKRRGDAAGDSNSTFAPDEPPLPYYPEEPKKKGFFKKMFDGGDKPPSSASEPAPKRRGFFGRR